MATRPDQSDQLALVRALKAQNETLSTENRALKDGGGGGTSTPVTEDPLKPRVDFLYTAFLWLAGIMITGILALFATMLTLSSSANARTDKLNETMSQLNREVGTVSSKVDNTNARLDRVEKKLDIIIERLPR